MKPFKILIIEDDPIHGKIIYHILKNTGQNFQLLQSRNGFEALKILEKETPDLILTDWEMPEMSGIELCKKIQAIRDFEDIPVIMCTGIKTSSENLKTAFESGVVDFIRKPIDKVELMSRVNSMLKLSESYQTIKRQKEEIEAEKEKSDKLLLNILPQKIANDLKEFGEIKPKLYKDVTVFYSDIVGFTEKTMKIHPNTLLNELNDIVKGFDAIMVKNNCEKIKTVGDAYIAVCGLPIPNSKHAENILNAAIDTMAYLKKRNEKSKFIWEIRLGIDTGEVAGGIIGTNKFIYDIFGDPVNTASRLEQNSKTMRIHLSETTYKLVKDKYEFEEQAPLEVKGKGKMKMFFVK
ncbi:MAG: response regulator [Bacteroidales bacterium]|jgi:adenylate cyclase|nr:response regulator [Bacteroidales bacterium]